MNGRKQHPCKTIARSAILLSIAVAAALAVAVLLCFSAVSDDNSDGAVGDTFVVDGIQYWIKSENPKEVSVHKCIGTQVTVTIPSMVKGYNVTSIDKAAFMGCAEIETVNISEGVKTIEELGFSYCYSLKNVKLPSTLETIGTKAFKNCVSINTMKIPDTVKSIRSNAFESCIMLESVNIPSAVTEISKEVFFNCSSLKEITIPDSITLIGVNAFAKCSALKFILIPDSVRKIDDCAFAECTDLELVEIGSGVASVGYNMGAFSGCLKIAYISLNCSTISKMTFDEYALKYTDGKIDRGKYVATGRLESGKIEMKYYDYDTNHCVVAYSDEKMVHGPEMVNEVIAPQIPARIGGTFKGWAIAGDSTGQLYDPGEVVDVAPGKDVIFVAVWIDPTPPPTPTPTPTPTPVPVPVPTPVPTPVPVMDNTAIPVALVMLAIIALLSIMVVLMARRK